MQGEPVTSRGAERVTAARSGIFAATTISVSRDRTACQLLGRAGFGTALPRQISVENYPSVGRW
jgi:hypothetical protein